MIFKAIVVNRSGLTPGIIMFDLPVVEGNKEITEIVIGPTPNPLLSHSTAIKLIRGNSYNCTKFTDSNVPYREW